MSHIPSYETRTSKRYHDLCEKLCHKYCYKDNGHWKLPNSKVNEIPDEEFDVLFKYPPITELVIHPEIPKQSEMNYFSD